jgi:hypothetical protein
MKFFWESEQAVRKREWIIPDENGEWCGYALPTDVFIIGNEWGAEALGAYGVKNNKIWVNVDGEQEMIFCDSLEEAKAMVITMVMLSDKRDAA